MAAEVRADANLCIGAVRGELQSRVCGNRARAATPIRLNSGLPLLGQVLHLSSL